MPYVKVHETWEDQPTETTPLDAAALMQIEAGIAAAQAAAEAGVPGDTGETGDSAYEVAVAAGFVGDEAAWLASLVGPAGDATVVTAGDDTITIGGTASAPTVAVTPDTFATLDVSGKVETSQLPALAITDTFAVASQVAMLALTAEVGDVAVRSDLSKSFILAVSPASTLANWKELLSPTDAVTSVNGEVGVVTLDAAAVGAQPVDADLTAIAALTTTATGRSLLAAADAAALRAITGAAAAGTIVIPETHTYAIQGPVTTSTVFPPFFVDESVGTLVLAKVRTKLTSGTATLKVRNNGVDEATGIACSSTATTNDFADEALTDLDAVDIVCTAASSPVDLTVTLFFLRTLTLA